MENIKEIKDRIDSIRDTKKITNAMYLIASIKLKKAKSELDKTRPYFAMLQSEIKRLFRIASDVESKYFYPLNAKEKASGVHGILVITADKGLAGTYNQNILKYSLNMLSDYPNSKLFVVGEYGRQFFMQHHIPIEQSFLYTAQNPTLHRAREICLRLLSLYDSEELDKIYIVYTDLSGSQTEEVRMTRLLPFHRSDFASNEVIDEKFEYEPSVAAVLNHIIRSYVTGFVYSALVDSYCSEQNARMSAMNAANQNAEEILSVLSHEYNRVRQTMITQEITEVTSGAKAMKKKVSQKWQQEKS